MNNKTKKGMLGRFLDDDLSTSLSPAPPLKARVGKTLGGMDVLNKAMDVLGTAAAPMMADIGSIDIDPKNKRALSPAEFQRLKASIEADGLFNPITVRKSDDPQYAYMAVAGHNRLQAMKELGHRSVPVNVVDLKDDGAKAAFISNLLQPELGIAEIFEGLRILRSAEGDHKSVRELASETGFSTAYISQVLSMEQLPSELVLAMKRARVRVGTNVLKGFVKVVADSQEDEMSQMTQRALAMIEATSVHLSALSPTLSDVDRLVAEAGEDLATNSWKKALSKFVAEHSVKPVPIADRLKRKVDLRGWILSSAVRRKNTIVLSFEDDGEAEQFLKLYEQSKTRS